MLPLDFTKEAHTGCDTRSCLHDNLPLFHLLGHLHRLLHILRAIYFLNQEVWHVNLIVSRRDLKYQYFVDIFSHIHIHFVDIFSLSSKEMVIFFRCCTPTCILPGMLFLIQLHLYFLTNVIQLFLIIYVIFLFYLRSI